MDKRCTRVPHIIMPKKGTDLSKWAVIACDQYTSEPEYWQETERVVGTAPSTLRLTLPEVYLEEPDVSARISTIHQTMQQYVADGTLYTLPAGFVLTERQSGGAHPRRGLVLAMDLEDYEYKAGSQSLIRPTEKTVEERIPPRLAVRRGASLELPHIMILIDDPERTVIEPLFDKKDSFETLYDTDLMQNGGHITGWFIPEGDETEAIQQHLEALCDRDAFNKKYGCTDAHALLPYAVGDGNHSVATAKAYWDEVKQELSEAERADHPARFVLVEVVNIHDESLIIEPIHRLLFNVDVDDLLDASVAYFAKHGCSAELAAAGTGKADEHTQVFPFISDKRCGDLIVKNAPYSLPLASLQAFLDDYYASHADAKIDYIHGTDVIEARGTQPGNMGFFLPDIAKNDLFRGVIFDGVLPRKTFSMGEAHEKRYYLEAKAIVK